MLALIDSIVLYKAACSVVQNKWYLLSDQGQMDVENYWAGKKLQKELGGDLYSTELDRGFPAACAVLKKVVQSILAHTEADDYLIFMSDPESSTFRHSLATEKVYKGHRRAKPKYLKDMYHYVIKRYKHFIATKHREDDDEMGIMQTKALEEGRETIICSTDKDLLQIPGWHYHLDKKVKFYVEPEGKLVYNDKVTKPYVKGTGRRWFYAQLILGDTADNIPAVPAVYTKLVSDKTYHAERIYDALHVGTEEQMLEKIIKVYKAAYGDAWQATLTERGRLLKILTCHDKKLWTVGG